MNYAQIKLLDSEVFRRLTGVKQDTFEKLLVILRESDKAKKCNGGRKEIKYNVVLIDATETPIERPKKDKENSTLARRRGIR